MNIKVERLTSELINECEPIVNRNHKETGQFIEDLNINWDAYLLMKDHFLAIIMRNEENKICGILFFIVSSYSHISNLIVAQQVTFFIDKQYRLYSIKMLKFSENLFENSHVDFILQSARYHTSFCSVLSKLGYEPSDLTFIKRIE